MSTFTRIVSLSAAATERVGRAIAPALPRGAVVALHGDLGTGKTVLSRGIARGLGIQEAVTSPTFTVVQEYACPDGRWFYHLDLYRIGDAGAALAFGAEEFLFAPDGIAAVEWPERMAELLVPAAAGDDAILHDVRLEHGPGDARTVYLPARLEACVRQALAGDPELRFDPPTEANP